MAIKVTQLNRSLETKQDCGVELPSSLNREETLTDEFHVESNEPFVTTTPAEAVLHEKALLQAKLHEVGASIKDQFTGLAYQNLLKEQFDSLSHRNLLKEHLEDIALMNPLKDQFANLGVANLFKDQFANLGVANPFKDQFANLGFVNPFKNQFDNLGFRNPFKNQFEDLGFANPLKDQFDNLDYLNPIKWQFDNLGYVNPMRDQFADLGFSRNVKDQLAYLGFSDSLHNSFEELAFPKYLSKQLESLRSACSLSHFENIYGLKQTVKDITDALARPLGLWKRIDEIERAREAFNSCDFNFLEEFISPSFVEYLGSLSSDERNDVLAELMWQLSQSSEFGDALQQVFMSHPILAERWTGVSEGLSVHCDCKFIASVRTIIPEFEGMLGDAMFARGEATRRGKKIYAIDAAGDIRLDDKNKKIVLMGLDSKIDNCYASDAPILMTLNDRFLKQLPPIRNKIAHGDAPRDANQMFSTRLVWALYVLAYAVAIELIAADTVKSAAFPIVDARKLAKSNLSDAIVFLTHEDFAATA